MAILDGGPNGGFSGKVGSVVGYLRYGKWLIRALPKKRKDKPSSKQSLSRSGFTAVQHFLGPLLPFIRVGFNLDAQSKNMSAHNAAKSNIMRMALNTEGTIDYSKVNLSSGNLPGVKEPAVAADDAGLHFSWRNNQNEPGVGYNDQVMIAGYAEQLHQAFFILSGARRSEGYEKMSLDTIVTGHTYHVWMAFISDDRRRISTSVYVGEVDV
ncbi:DUF6266 family protein [Pedobacter rhodius]|uniref:DUF6266 family protein n=1 Tax=Pedobacter rhodius TaxID=3004098 RepID=A0ABT4KUM7_9SPHI|nr:DUF6266 family protein [Pedobacter sp. SJ11]MCZ4221942.1 DUF6266 family protein [Pedobacter sp. SJ11]